MIKTIRTKHGKFDVSDQHDWKDISDEEYRVYGFAPPNSDKNVHVRIDEPALLAVSESGGHRVVDSTGHAHYVPTGWYLLTWKSREGEAHVAF